MFTNTWNFNIKNKKFFYLNKKINKNKTQYKKTIKHIKKNKINFVKKKKLLNKITKNSINKKKWQKFKKKFKTEMLYPLKNKTAYNKQNIKKTIKYKKLNNEKDIQPFTLYAIKQKLKYRRLKKKWKQTLNLNRFKRIKTYFDRHRIIIDFENELDNFVTPLKRTELIQNRKPQKINLKRLLMNNKHKRNISKKTTLKKKKRYKNKKLIKLKKQKKKTPLLKNLKFRQIYKNKTKVYNNFFLKNLKKKLLTKPTHKFLKHYKNILKKLKKKTHNNKKFNYSKTIYIALYNTKISKI